MEELASLISKITGIEVTPADILTNLIASIVIIVLARTALAARVIFLIGALFIKKFRNEQCRRNAHALLRHIRNNNQAIVSQSEMILDLALMLLYAMLALFVHLWEIEAALNKIHGPVITETNTLMLHLASEHGRWLKFICGLIALFNFTDAWLHADLLRYSMLVRHGGLTYLQTRHKTKKKVGLGYSLGPEGGAQILNLILFIVVVAILVYGYWFYS